MLCASYAILHLEMLYKCINIRGLSITLIELQSVCNYVRVYFRGEKIYNLERKSYTKEASTYR